MPTWRCPHCGTPQAEAARCWVCRRSSTCCSTCRHFRESVAANVGYCGLDRQRVPLTGSELRPCWESAPPRTEAIEAAPEGRNAPAGQRPRRAFVPIETRDARETLPSAPPAVPPVLPSAARYGLFADSDG